MDLSWTAVYWWAECGCVSSCQSWNISPHVTGHKHAWSHRAPHPSSYSRFSDVVSSSCWLTVFWYGCRCDHSDGRQGSEWMAWEPCLFMRALSFQSSSSVTWLRLCVFAASRRSACGCVPAVNWLQRLLLFYWGIILTVPKKASVLPRVLENNHR